MDGVETEYGAPDDDDSDEEGGSTPYRDYDEPTWSGQIAAMRWFEDLTPAHRRELDIHIIEGEMPGSSYFAAELFADIDDANATAEQLGLECRFKAPGRSSSC